MRETTWIAMSSLEIDRIIRKLEGENEIPELWVSVRAITPINIRIRTNNGAYLNYLSRNFSSIMLEGSSPQATLTYIPMSLEKLRDMVPTLPEILTPSVGFFDSDNMYALLCGEDEYGLLKSTVVGLHSRYVFPLGWRPIHGAVIRFNGDGVVIVGHHGAGKSTALFNLIHRLHGQGELKVLTDDWAVAKPCEEGQISIKSIERRMSFTEKLALENPEINMLGSYATHTGEGIGKAWVDIEELLWVGAYANTAPLKKVLVFSGSPAKTTVSNLLIDDVIELLVDSAYHMPDEKRDIRNMMHYFWLSNLRPQQCFQINNRHEEKKKDQIYDEIIEALWG